MIDVAGPSFEASATMGRAPCCDKERINKGPWTEAEDTILSAYIKAHGEGCWRTLPKAAGNKTSTYISKQRNMQSYVIMMCKNVSHLL